MAITRWDPMMELRRAHHMMNRAWPTFGFDFPMLTDGETENWSIPLDVVREGDNITVHAAVPGVKPDDIDVTIEDGVLTIKAETKMDEERKEGEYMVRERRHGTFHRSVRLPDTVDAEKAEPHYENGVLTVKLPVAEAKKAKHLKVTAGKVLEEAK